MCDFQSEIARNISLLKGTDGYRFASRYKWSIVKNESHFTTVLKYIYQNPVRAKIVRNAETYPYSTLRGLLGLSKLQIPIKPHEMGREFFKHPASDWLDSINCKFDSKEVAAIQAGLRRAEFKVAGSRISAGKRRSLGG